MTNQDWHQSRRLPACPRLGVALAFFLLPLALSLLMAGCRRGGDPDTLVIAIELPPRGFDPRLSTGFIQSARIMQLIYDTLVVKDEHFDFVPSLAEEFTESPDAMKFSFRLRPGVTFHNGQPLTSADVKYTFDSLLDPRLKSPIRPSLDKLVAVETPDALTVIFHAREPFYTFMGNLPAIGIIPRDDIDNPRFNQIDAPVGSGPYTMASHSESDGTRLEANQNYWGGAPTVPRLHIRVISDNSTRQAALMSGEVDLAYNAQFDPETVRALSARRDMQVVIGEGASIGYLGLNLTPASELANAKVRQAIAYGIDREVIIRQLLRGQAREASAIMPPEHWAYNQAITVYDHDPARARALLDEAGFRDPDGDGPAARFELSMLTQTSQLSRNIASILQDQLRRIGIQLNLESLESQTFFARLNNANFGLYYLIGIGFNQSTDVFQFVYHSRYQNGEFTGAVARLRAATDPAEMQAIFGQLASILARRDYCPSAEVDRLAAEAARTANATARRQIYLQIAGLLTDRGGQNRMRYCNPQVDSLIVEAERASDRAAKIDLYGKVQKTVSDELPQIYLWHPANILVARRRVGNIQIEASGSWSFITKLTLENQ
jgi:peptide/nickel transport system substrate-binding protein